LASRSRSMPSLRSKWYATTVACWVWHEYPDG
jgi:hypothetical protein